MSDVTRTNQDDAQLTAVDSEKLIIQARMALKTGMSAYENGNFAFSETLLVKALDLFEQAKSMEDVDYFQCLHQIADTYFQLGRYYEAKSYYERLSVARLKNPDSTDAQVVVALLKLASTYQKLGEDAEALTAFDLIMELAEKTIPTGHALFGVIFDSYEDLITRSLTDEEERDRRQGLINDKREQFGFPKQSSEVRWANAMSAADPEKDAPASLLGSKSEIKSEATETGHSGVANSVAGVLAQKPDQLRKSLKAWTHVDMPKPQIDAISESVSRVNQDRLAELQSNFDDRKPVDQDKLMQAHLHPNMFKRRSASELEAEEAQRQEREKALDAAEAGGSEREYAISSIGGENESGEADLAGDTEDGGSEGEAGEPYPKRFAAERGALKGAKRPNTDKKRFNPLPALTVIGCIGVIGGAVFFAHEYAKNAALNDNTTATVSGKDFSGVIWASSDSKKQLRCSSAVNCSYTVGGASAAGVYQVAGAPAPDKSILSDFFNGKPTKLAFVESPIGLTSSDGWILYSEDSKDRAILNKAQAIANFATFYYASHGHVYPTSAQDFRFGNARFAWENPITGETNKPIVKKVESTKTSFDADFASNLKSLREGKAVFDADSSTGSNVGLIECLSLTPPAASGTSTGAGTNTGAGAEDAPASSFLIRAYNSEGKLIASSEPSKTFVIALKNGISTDPIKALHEEPTAALAPPAGKIEVEIKAMDAAGASNAGTASGAKKK